MCFLFCPAISCLPLFSIPNKKGVLGSQIISQMSVIYNYNRPLGLRSKKESKANTVGEIKEEKEMERGEEETGVPFLKGSPSISALPCQRLIQ